MPKKIRCFLREVGITDDDSIGVFLDFDGIENVEEVLKVIKERKKIGEQVTIWDNLFVLLLIYNANREKKEKK